MKEDLQKIDEKYQEIKNIEACLGDMKKAFVQNHCPYCIGDEIINDLDWCYRHMGKKIKITAVNLRRDYYDNYEWHIVAVVLKQDGQPGAFKVTGRKPL